MIEIGHRMKASSAVLLCAMMMSSMLVFLPGGAKAAPPDGWIEGVISDGVTPIEDAYVVSILMMGGEGPFATAWSDASGVYNLTVIGGLDYMVLAFHGDYLTSYGSASVEPGETSTLDLVMTPIAPAVADVVIQGFLKDELGNPLSVGTIFGMSMDPSGSTDMPYYGNATFPDVLGYFSVNVLPTPTGGGVGALDVPGYPFVSNETDSPLVSGMTYWMNITMEPATYSNDAVIHGTVTDADTGLPIENVLVNIQSQNEWNEGHEYSNYTFTDASGNYLINVTNGTTRVWFSAGGYSMYMVENLDVDSGADLTIDAELTATTATISGKITDLSDDSPISNARAFLTDGMGLMCMATTNSTGDYSMDVFDGHGLMMGGEASGYSRNWTGIDVNPGDNLVIDFGLWPVDAWLTGQVTDQMSGLPVPNANVWMHSSVYEEWTMVNATGHYNVSLVSGDYTVDVNAPDYMSESIDMTVVSGGNVLDVELLPWDLPETVRLYGWVNDSLTLTGIGGVQVQTTLDPPGTYQWDSTDSQPDGYYEIMVPSLELFWFARSNDYAHEEGTVDATGMTEIRMDILMDQDLWGPNVTYSLAPVANVSWTNPSIVDAVVEEPDLRQLSLWTFIYDHVMGQDFYYYAVEYLVDTWDPFDYSNNALPFSQAGDIYTVNYAWDAVMVGGSLSNLTDSLYLSSSELVWGPDTYDAVRGFYTNSSLGSRYSGTCWFDRATEEFAFFSFDDGGMPMAYPSDPTGVYTPVVPMISVNQDTGSWNWYGNIDKGNWSVVGLKFIYAPYAPSGLYAMLFAAVDFANHMYVNVTELTVDNMPPVADAGSDQLEMGGVEVWLDGSDSTDNVGIVSWKWTFTYDGGEVVLWGEQVNFTFWIEGTYVITLTVTDAAGHEASDTVDVTISGVIPEFPTLLLPITGLLGLLVLFRYRAGRRKS